MDLSGGVRLPVRVMVVEDHVMVLAGLVEALGADPNLEIVGSAATLAQAAGELCACEPDVVVTDYQLPDGVGADLVDVASSCRRPAAVVLISGRGDREAVEAALSSGCAGFVSKGRGLDELIRAIMAVAAGAAVFPARALADLTRGDTPPLGAVLTERELEVLGLLADAHNAEEIAAVLHLSVHTVRNHIRAILSKMHARSQLEAVVLAVRAGLVTID